jgi:zinc transporter
MTNDDLREAALRPGLVWGFDFVDGRALPVDDIDLLKPDARPPGLRWLHFNLADQRTLRWLAATRPVSPLTADLLLSADPTQRYVVDQDALGLVLHDLELDFLEGEPRVGVVRIALGPSMIVTGRHHPVRSAEAMKRRIELGAAVSDPGSALELIFGGMTDVFRDINADLDAQVQAIEDELLKDRPTADARTFINIRSLMVRMRRLFSGSRAMLRRLEDDHEAPRACVDAAARFVVRLSTLDSELLATQSQLRLLRDELDLQATQQTNQNLYFLSILSALLMPATLVTGIFGMNTGGLPWAGDRLGTVLATGAALGSALLVYVVLRLSGFIRR